MPILAKFCGEYADEFSCYAFKVFPSRQNYEEWLSAMEQEIATKGDIEHYFGSNEWLQYSSIYHLESDIQTTEISEVEAAVFAKHFPDYGFGTGNIFDYEFQELDDEEED